MTACIVGWSHLPFGKHERPDVEDLVVEAARERRRRCRARRRRTSTPSMLGHFNGGFVPQDFTSSLVLQADRRLPLQARDPRRERLRHRLGRDPSRA